MSVGTTAIAGVVIMDERAGQDAGSGRGVGMCARSLPQGVLRECSER